MKRALVAPCPARIQRPPRPTIKGISLEDATRTRRGTCRRSVFVEAGYVRADIVDESGDGFFAKGSVAFGESFYGHASYQEATNDDLGFDVSLNETVLGVGYRHAMGTNVDLIAEASYVNLGAEIDVDGFGSDSSDGYRAAVGVRGMMTPQFEGTLKGYYTEISDLDDGEFGLQVGAVFHINQTWGIVRPHQAAGRESQQRAHRCTRQLLIQQIS